MASLLRRLARPAVLIPLGVPVGLYTFAKLNPDAASAYYKRGFAWACARSTESNNKKLQELKQDMFTGLKEQDGGSSSLQVLEIGAGSGANFKYFPPGTSVIAVDPNPHFDQYLKENSDEYPEVKVTKFVVAGAEDMADVAEGSVDAVVCTLVLCSVHDVDAVLGEVKRVLKPGGKFYFLEHVRHPTQAWVQSLQDILTPVFRVLSDGCQPNRETWKHVDSAGFSDVQYKIEGNLRPKVIMQILYGTATK
ncbi:methyltransferase-like protein 7A [Branchiostoma floridae]|uniref:Methyltransferase-like protein 7A n=1 Tax=Branchiostoma floridae TaxID=7739 RepID=A0A9J7LEG0_BRAFL|nr:methyltransferase-like protein 7A [Branchiostoma floridae]